ncbi:aminotransferase class I/II-fold pyridoxal phosphate-dependent enzyme [Haliangium ochraceum]|uniref:Aminotransferase class I and II n=1 Tax=Haliangium ochraceum (strain DSM 14365 / JCM 11303 / SMP-2) TaxID=502025 RepID=D0LZN4_HALO1|nr:aminotransferase class I/II-fold pyridoxal phosphate-dependent enzyme [Haliangium ochraceum]ACY18013.1 aminotransferase class I and II [Haliangium ochraceum DSM 14365]
MAVSPISRRARMAAAALAPLTEFLTHSAYRAHQGRDDIGDFVFGNPHDMPLPGVVNAFKQWIEPRDKNWYAYKQSEARARALVAANLRESHGLPFEPEDVAMTQGAFAAMAVAFPTLLDPGDEVIFSVPSWFFYESMLVEFGAVPVKVGIRADDFDLDIAAIAAAITPRTRMVIVNTPHNPTGRIYPPATLRTLAQVLEQASARHGRRIYLLSDEPYRRLVFDERPFYSPAASYPATLISYSYGKVLLTPGARIGYLATSPNMPERELVHRAIHTTQMSAGWMFPNALLQHAIEELEAECIDLAVLTRKRDRLAGALRDMGYEVFLPEGTFYLLCRSPLDDDLRFCEELGRHGVFVLPGTTCELPGFLRICLTATEAMIERSIDGFARAIAALGKGG